MHADGDPGGGVAGPVGPDAGSPGAALVGAAPPVVAQSVWLERFYDLVLVSAITHFATQLGRSSDARDLLGTIGWLAGLWLAWFLVTTRLNRFPDAGPLTRAIVVVQLLALTVGVAAAVTPTLSDRRTGIVAVAVMSFAIAALYLTVPTDLADRRLVRIQLVGNVLLGMAVLSMLVLPVEVGTVLTGAVAVGWAAVLLLVYLPGVARTIPVRPDHAATRYGQLFTVLLGLSFLTVAFDTTSTGSVSVLTTVGAFAAGFALFSLYIDGVLPYGFPTVMGRQQVWLVAQLVLAVSLTVAAAGVRAVPSSLAGTVTATQAWLEAGALALVMASLAVLALTSQRSARGPAAVRAGAALVLTGLGLWASVTASGAGVPDGRFAAVLAAVLVVAAGLDAAVRLRGPARRLPTG